MPRRPEVFISATSADLGEVRPLVRDALLAIGCHPILQEHFAPDGCTVRDMLRHRITTSDAVIHLVGVSFGAEPAATEAGSERRSYAQMEYDFAIELRKPLYIFLLSETFPYASHTLDPEDSRRLQCDHRAAIAKGNHLYQIIADRTELAERIREIRIKLGSENVERPKRGLAMQFRGCSMSLALSVAICVTFFVSVGRLWTTRSTKQELPKAPMANQNPELMTAEEEAAKTAAAAADKVAREQLLAKQLRENQMEEERLGKLEEDKLQAAELVRQQQQRFEAAIAKVAEAISRRDLSAARQNLLVAQQVDPTDPQLADLSARIGALNNELRSMKAESPEDLIKKSVVKTRPKPQREIKPERPGPSKKRSVGPGMAAGG